MFQVNVHTHAHMFKNDTGVYVTPKALQMQSQANSAFGVTVESNVGVWVSLYSAIEKLESVYSYRSSSDKSLWMHPHLPSCIPC